ncbi:DMT family transporter [Candidatus Gottesmanbacteria bacterium]|nr:DMT family transporter [Candidatus Gottesmanbacteria bacterium]
MRLTSVQKAFLALIVANLLWGAGSPIFKLALQNVPLFTLAFLRFSLGAVVLLIILRSRIFFTVHERKDLLLLIGYALAGITFNIIFFFLGLTHTLAINGGVIASSAPIMTFFFALMFLHETFSLKKFVGMLLGLAGIGVIVFEPLLKAGLDGSVVGNVYLLLATVGAVVAIVIGRDLFKRYSPLMLTFWAFVVSSATFLPLAVVDYLRNPALYSSLDARGFTGIIWGVLFSSAAAYSLQAWGLARISATDTAMFTYIDPVSAAILSVILLHEPITALFLVGGALIFGGIWIAEGRLHYHPFHKLRTTKKPPKSLTSHAPIERTEVIKRIFK